MFRRQSARTGDTGRGVRSEDQRLAEVFFGCGGNGTSMSIVRRVVGYAVCLVKVIYVQDRLKKM
jgi:hypothetical protein